jgi:hypothetical protein
MWNLGNTISHTFQAGEGGGHEPRGKAFVADLFGLSAANWSPGPPSAQLTWMPPNVGLPRTSSPWLPPIASIRMFAGAPPAVAITSGFAAHAVQRWGKSS